MISTSKQVQISGLSFGDTINLSNDAGDSYDYQVNIPINDTMYVVWQDETQGVNGTSEIYFKKSTDRERA